MDRRINVSESGFTLIELMIVVAVLAILTVSVSLSVTRPRAGIESDVTRFQAVHERLRSQAILSRQIQGLRLTNDGYQALRWDGADWQDSGGQVSWRQNVAVQIPFDLTAPVQFGPSGQVTAVQVRFEGNGRALICASDGWAKLSCDAG